MPLYEYHCKKCEGQFELLVRFSEKPTCPKCKDDTLEKMLSVIASPSVKASSSGGMCQPSGCELPQCGPVGGG